MTDKKKILIVEDESILLAPLTKKLERDFQVLGANTGEDGLEIVKKYKPDLLLLDLMLPGMSGEELLKNLRDHKKFSDLPVIIMSAKSDDATISHCLNTLNASDFLVKSNCTLEEVAEKIKKILSRTGNSGGAL